MKPNLTVFTFLINVPVLIVPDSSVHVMVKKKVNFHNLSLKRNAFLSPRNYFFPLLIVTKAMREENNTITQ